MTRLYYVSLSVAAELSGVFFLGTLSRLYRCLPTPAHFSSITYGATWGVFTLMASVVRDEQSPLSGVHPD